MLFCYPVFPASGQGLEFIGLGLMLRFYGLGIKALGL